jgi:acyl dehydratase
MPGRYFEEFEVGETFTTIGRTITEADVVAFAGLSGDFTQIHTDEEFARASVFGRRVAQGLLVLSVASGLRMRLGIVEGTLVALLGLEDWRFRAPVFIGDTVHVRMETIEKRLGSEPGRGIVTHAVEIMNQRDEVVQSGRIVIMVRTRA